MMLQVYFHSNEVATLSFFRCLPPAFDCTLLAKLHQQLVRQNKPQCLNRHRHVRLPLWSASKSLFSLSTSSSSISYGMLAEGLLCTLENELELDIAVFDLKKIAFFPLSSRTAIYFYSIETQHVPRIQSPAMRYFFSQIVTLSHY